jgi:hypothetical protein
MKLMKTLFIWLLLLALPLQGYAAAALNICSSGSPPPRAQAHCHVVSAKADKAVSHESASADAGHCQDASTSHKCSNCSFCAFGAACVPTSTPPLAAKPAGAERIDYLPHYVTSRLPAGLERPPHTQSA